LAAGRTLGIPLDRLVGQSGLSGIYPDDAPLARAALKEVVESFLLAGLASVRVSPSLVRTQLEPQLVAKFLELIGSDCG
jgi:hypothetical protein